MPLARYPLPLLILLLSLPAAAQEKKIDFMAQLVAKGFFRALVDGEHKALVPLCAPREVNFDGRIARGAKQVRQQLEAMATRAKRQGLKLRKVELLRYRDAVKRFGPPPPRLKGNVGPGMVVALGAFARRGAVLVLAKQGRFWRVVAVTD